MQTFLPYEDFAESARVLDRQRLGKQRVETLQILNALVTGKGWINHPATKMWRDHIPALVLYQHAVCHEWTHNRGYRDTCLEKTINIAQTDGTNAVMPMWLGDQTFHLSHQSNLVRKDPAFYGPQFPGVPDTLPYIWPIEKGNT